MKSLLARTLRAAGTKLFAVARRFEPAAPTYTPPPTPPGEQMQRALQDIAEWKIADALQRACRAPYNKTPPPPGVA